MCRYKLDSTFAQHVVVICCIYNILCNACAFAFTYHQIPTSELQQNRTIAFNLCDGQFLSHVSAKDGPPMVVSDSTQVSFM